MTRPRYYDYDGEPISMMEWAQLIEARTSDLVRWQVGYDVVGDATVSTVWLGLDHRFGDGPPLIFESLVFGGPRDDETRRYTTEAEALEGHAQLVAELRDARGVAAGPAALVNHAEDGERA